jgi:hypothetical protein
VGGEPVEQQIGDGIGLLLGHPVGNATEYLKAVLAAYIVTGLVCRL